MTTTESTRMSKYVKRGMMAMLLALAGCAAVKPQLPAAPVAPTHSVAEADRKLAQATRERAQAEAAFGASEQLCYAKFLVNNCLDKAREKHRLTLAGLRAIELEADHYKRQARADERDRELARAEVEFQAEQARMAAAPPPPRVERAEAAPRPEPVPRDRPAEQAAKVTQRAAREKAGAAQRAANVEAYEKRKRASEQRQKEIADKKKAAVSEGEER